MPPKKATTKADKGQQKAAEKQKAKIIEDKTFGLKNKNKSKAVQKYIKEVTQQVKGGNQKGGTDGQTQKQIQEKEEKKKNLQQQALLASLFRGTENIKKISEKAGSDAGGKSAANQNAQSTYDPKMFREFQKIDLYVDQRILKNIEGYESMMSGETRMQDNASVTAALDVTQNAQTDIVCKFFLDAVEKKQYGWFWVCPNGGDNCKYRHCLPQGYVLKKDKEEDEEEEEIPIEEQIENERRLLPAGGTPVTLETFLNWKKKKEAERIKDIEDKKAKQTAGTTTNDLKLTGRDLFAFNPSVFVDDEGAASENDYEEDEEYWNKVINENQQTLQNANDSNKQQENGDSKNQPSDDENPKREADDLGGAKPNKEELFLDDLPEDLEDLDD